MYHVTCAVQLKRHEVRRDDRLASPENIAPEKHTNVANSVRCQDVSKWKTNAL